VPVLRRDRDAEWCGTPPQGECKPHVYTVGCACRAGVDSRVPKTDEEVADEAKRKFQQEFDKNVQDAQRKTEEQMRRIREQLGY
jgi:hypothetical protein